VLQDARAWGTDGESLSQSVITPPGQPALPSFAPWEGYFDVHSRSGRRTFVRVGRQAVSWGDGLLLGTNDWSAAGRSLDAVRLAFQVGDFDLEALASLVAPPGRYVDPDTSVARYGTGAQLYGVNAAYHLMPLAHFEVAALARIARQPTPTTLVPSDTFVVSGRAFGKQRGLEYAVEGAYEGGRVAEVGTVSNLEAFAFAGRASLETSLPWHVTFGVQGAYASGGQASSWSSNTLKRFDPILPDEHTVMSPMRLWAWSNMIEGGGSVGCRPLDEVALFVTYAYAALADPADRWTSGSMTVVGALANNKHGGLGHEIDAALRFTPWPMLEAEAGYGIFAEDGGGSSILKAAGREASPAQWAYLATRLVFH
jgi:Alginate export